jgi:hypothetical protein
MHQEAEMLAWLKRLWEKSRGTDQELSKVLEEAGTREARRHHYVFAHYALRTLLLGSPKLIAVLASERGDAFLHEVWRDVGDDVLKQGQGERLAPDGLEVVGEGRSGDYFVVVVRLPEPVGITEAFYVGAALGPLTEGADPASLDEAPRRYFTLEVGFTLGPPRTVLAEWTTDAHFNFGDGPPPEPDAFLAALQEMLASAPVD